MEVCAYTVIESLRDSFTLHVYLFVNLKKRPWKGSITVYALAHHINEPCRGSISSTPPNFAKASTWHGAGQAISSGLFYLVFLYPGISSRAIFELNPSNLRQGYAWQAINSGFLFGDPGQVNYNNALKRIPKGSNNNISPCSQQTEPWRGSTTITKH
jgi:hypothetical protein